MRSIGAVDNVWHCQQDSCGSACGKPGHQSGRQGAQAKNRVGSGQLKLESRQPTEWQRTRRAIRQSRGTKPGRVEIESIELDVQPQQHRAMEVSKDSISLDRESMFDSQRLSRGTTRVTGYAQKILNFKNADSRTPVHAIVTQHRCLSSGVRRSTARIGLQTIDAEDARHDIASRQVLRYIRR